MGIGNINALKPENWVDLPYEPDPVLDAWEAAVANRPNARANIVLMGPSTVEGYPTTNFDLTIAQQLALRLRVKNPTEGLANLGKRGGRGRLGVPTPEITPAIPSPLSFTAGAFDPTTELGIPAFHIGANHVCWYTNVLNQKFTFTMKSDETSFDLVLGKGPAGHATAGWYTIDGGVQVPFSTVAGVNTLDVMNVEADGGSVIEVGCSGSGYLILAEVILYAGDENKGIMVHGVGRSGYTCEDWVLGANIPGGWRESLANLDPDLLIIESGANDATHVSAVQFGSDLTAEIETIREGPDPLSTVPILIVAPYDFSSAAAMMDPWRDYVTEMETIADGDSTISFFNHGDLMPSTNAAQTNGYYYTDFVHGSADGKGYAKMAENLANHLPKAAAITNPTG